MDKNKASFTIVFALGLSAVLAIGLAGAYEGLKTKIRANELYDQQVNVLVATGLYKPDPAKAPPTRKDLEGRFEEFIKAEVLEVKRGLVEEKVKRAGKEQRIKVPRVTGMIRTEHAVADLGRLRLEESRKPDKTQRKEYAAFYTRIDDKGVAQAYAIPIHGPGLWGPIYGFLSLKADGDRVQGITFYKHKETAGLGAEIQNPNWQAQWVDKRVYGPDGEFVSVIVKKGSVIDAVAREKRHMVDGLSGATITSNSVTALVRKGIETYKPWFDKLKKGR